MKKTTLLLIVMMASVQLWAEGTTDRPGAEDKATITVTDCIGREVVVPSDATKFVAIGPGCLRLYCYVGDVSEIVGVEQLEVKNGSTGRPYVKANPGLLELPVIGPGGPGNAPDPERILDVFPDVIFSLYNSDASSVDELQNKTGIPVVALSYGETEVFDPMIDYSLELLGRITGEEARAAAVTRFFDDCKDDLQARTVDVAESDKPRSYFGAQSMRGSHGIESTRGNYSLFNAVNARNVVEEAGINAYVMLDKEKLLDLDPDIIVLDAGGLALVQKDYSANTQFYEGLSAFKNGRVYMQLPYNYYYTNIDTALCDAYYIGSILYPDSFADIDIRAKADGIYTFLLGEALYNQVAGEYYGGFQNLNFK